MLKKKAKSREIELISWLPVGFRDLKSWLLTYPLSWFISLLMWTGGSTFPLCSMLVQSICSVRGRWCCSSVAVIYDNSKASIDLKKKKGRKFEPAVLGICMKEMNSSTWLLSPGMGIFSHLIFAYRMLSAFTYLRDDKCAKSSELLPGFLSFWG